MIENYDTFSEGLRWENKGKEDEIKMELVRTVDDGWKDETWEEGRDKG